MWRTAVDIGPQWHSILKNIDFDEVRSVLAAGVEAVHRVRVQVGEWAGTGVLLMRRRRCSQWSQPKRALRSLPTLTPLRPLVASCGLLRPLRQVWAEFAKPGSINDPDMLQVGNGGQVARTSCMQTLSTAEWDVHAFAGRITPFGGPPLFCCVLAG